MTGEAAESPLMLRVRHAMIMRASLRNPGTITRRPKDVPISNTALRTALAGRTSLVIAHRLSTNREADQILVLDDGQVRERGRHEELLAAGGMYADLYRTQFARQEPVGELVGVGARPSRPEGHFPPHPHPGNHDGRLGSQPRRGPSLPGRHNGA